MLIKEQAKRVHESANGEDLKCKSNIFDIPNIGEVSQQYPSS